MKQAVNVGRTLTQPSAEGVKETTTQVAKAAAKGAATGGWVGAARGAAVAFAKTNAGRRIIAIVAVLALVSALIVPAGLLGFMLLVSSNSTDYGNTYRSGQSVTQSGRDKGDVTEGIALGSQYGIRWELALAVREVAGEDTDLEPLGEILSHGKIRTLGAGATYVQGKGLVIGKNSSEQDAHNTERDFYEGALAEFGMDEPDAIKAYEMALKWALGELESCTTTPERATEEGEGDITLDDGTKVALDDVQVQNIKTIIQHASKIEDVTPDAVIISLMAARVESGFRNYANSSVPDSLNYPNDAIGSDHDSLGFWQMRVGSWGTVAELMDPAYQVKAFFGGKNGPNKGSPRGLFDIPNWQKLPKGDAAQKVEVSAYPDRYAEHEELAEKLFERFGAGVTFCSGGLGMTGEGGHPLGDPSIKIGWGYGPRDAFCNTNPLASCNHKGLDFGVKCDHPIFAIADGKVIHSGPEGGWGNSVVIDHGNGLTTRSAHMPNGGPRAKVRENVTKGQQIGTVGQTGNAYGCHLHFETLINGKYQDPEQVLTEMGVQLNAK